MDWIKWIFEAAINKQTIKIKATTVQKLIIKIRFMYGLINGS